MKRNICKLLIVFIFCFLLTLCINNGRAVLAQLLPPFGFAGSGVPYYSLFASPLIGPRLFQPALTGPGALYYPLLPSSVLRVPGLVSRYQGLYPALNASLPLMSYPQPIIRRPNALTTLTTLKVLLPPGANTVVLNPFLSPVVVPITSLTIPITPTQAQPILLATGGATVPANPTSALLLNTLGAFLQAPSLISILPPTIGSLLTIVP